jgi:GNAT superfamily N-acetyltransferase
VATRIPFRHRGIAKQLVSYVLADAYKQGIRAVIINADQTGMPIEIYRRLGFTDEVFWRQGYKF